MTGIAEVFTQRVLAEPNAAGYAGLRSDNVVTVWRYSRRHFVALNPRTDVRNHSPDGFEWGYGGSGPAQLALAILCNALQNVELAQELYQAFKWAIVARLHNRRWRLSQTFVLRWCRRRCRELGYEMFATVDGQFRVREVPFLLESLCGPVAQSEGKELRT
jgi:hypothetical protein